MHAIKDQALLIRRHTYLLFDHLFYFHDAFVEFDLESYGLASECLDVYHAKLSRPVRAL